MCQNRTNNRKINQLHETSLQIIYNNEQASFIELLKKRQFCVYTPKKPTDLSH